MLHIGEYVMKTETGLCKVADIKALDGMKDKDKLFYWLEPVSAPNMVVYVPVDGNSHAIRKAISADTAWEIIHEIPDIEEVPVVSERLREQVYKDAIKSSDPEQLISLMKNIYSRKMKRQALGKKMTNVDERYFKKAEGYLFEELAFATGKDKSEMQKVVASSIKEMVTQE